MQSRNPLGPKSACKSIRLHLSPSLSSVNIVSGRMLPQDGAGKNINKGKKPPSLEKKLLLERKERLETHAMS